MNSEKNLTLAILNYANGKLMISGQHEEILVVRQGGEVQRIDTIDLGFPIGLLDEIDEFIDHKTVDLSLGDGIILYTDGITEAMDMNRRQYGLNQLCEIVSQHWSKSAQEIKKAVISDVKRHVGQQKIFDDITLLVLKRKL